MLEDQEHPAFVSFFLHQASQDRRRWFAMMPYAVHGPSWGSSDWEDDGRKLIHAKAPGLEAGGVPSFLLKECVSGLGGILSKGKATVDVNRFDPNRLEAYSKEFFTAMESEPETGDDWAAVVSDEAGQEMRRVLFAVGEYIHNCTLPERAMSCEAIDRQFLWTIEQSGIGSSERLRYLAHLANRAKLVPSVLVLPNQHQMDNPFLIAVTGTRQLPFHALRLLRLFDR